MGQVGPGQVGTAQITTHAILIEFGIILMDTRTDRLSTRTDRLATAGHSQKQECHKCYREYSHGHILQI